MLRSKSQPHNPTRNTSALELHFVSIHGHDLVDVCTTREYNVLLLDCYPFEAPDWCRTIQTIVESLQNNDFYVVYYNARGVGKSTGRPSFTGKTEGSDLEALVQQFLEGHPQVNSVTFIVRRPRRWLCAMCFELKQ